MLIDNTKGSFVMKTLIEKLKALRIYAVISSAFKHDCSMNKKMLSSSYFKDGDSGVIFLTGKEYYCEKCGKRWYE